MDVDCVFVAQFTDYDTAEDDAAAKSDQNEAEPSSAEATARSAPEVTITSDPDSPVDREDALEVGTLEMMRRTPGLFLPFSIVWPMWYSSCFPRGEILIFCSPEEFVQASHHLKADS